MGKRSVAKSMAGASGLLDPLPEPVVRKQTVKKSHGGARGRTWTEGEAFALLDQTGIDAICDRITSGLSMRAIAEAAGVTKNALWRWLAADIDCSARASGASIDCLALG